MAGLGITGVTGGLVDGPFDTDLFNCAFCSFFLDKIGRFAFSKPRSIVILDNCSIHNVELIEMIHNVGGLVTFLPPYSPDFNPMELVFRSVKAWLCQNRDEAQMNLKRSIYSGLNEISRAHAEFFLTMWILYMKFSLLSI